MAFSNISLSVCGASIANANTDISDFLWIPVETRLLVYLHPVEYKYVFMFESWCL